MPETRQVRAQRADKFYAGSLQNPLIDKQKVTRQWLTENGGPVKALFHAVSTDGRSFTPRVRLPTQGQANHPQLAIRPDGRVGVLVGDVAGKGMPASLLRSSLQARVKVLTDKFPLYPGLEQW